MKKEIIIILTLFAVACEKDPDSSPNCEVECIKTEQLAADMLLGSRVTNKDNAQDDDGVTKIPFYLPDNATLTDVSPSKIHVKDNLPDYSTGQEKFMLETAETPSGASVYNGKLEVDLSDSKDRDGGIPAGSEVELEEGAFTFEGPDGKTYKSQAGTVTIADSDLSPQHGLLHRALNGCPLELNNTTIFDKYHFNNNNYDPLTDTQGGNLPDFNSMDDARTAIQSKLEENGYSASEANEWLSYITPGSSNATKGDYTFNGNPTTAYQIMSRLRPGSINEDWLKRCLGEVPGFPKMKFSLDTETDTDNLEGQNDDGYAQFYPMGQDSAEAIINTSHDCRLQHASPKTFEDPFFHEPMHSGNGSGSQLEERMIQRMTLYMHLLNSDELPELTRSELGGDLRSQTIINRVGKLFNGVTESTPEGEAVLYQRQFNHPQARVMSSGNNFLNEILANVGHNSTQPLEAGNEMGPYPAFMYNAITGLPAPSHWTYEAERNLIEAANQKLSEKFTPQQLKEIFLIYETSALK